MTAARDDRYDGFYINLDESVGRRASLESQLAQHMPNGQYERYAAALGTSVPPRGALSAGALGCYLSHLQLLERAGRGRVHVHVLEDDAYLTSATFPTVARLITDGILEQFDMVFTDVFLPLDSFQAHLQHQMYEASHVVTTEEADRFRLRLIELRHRPWASTVSYVIAHRAIARVTGLLRAELERGPRAPIDLVLRGLVDTEQIKAAMVFPFVTSIDLAHDAESTIRDAHDPQTVSRLACRLFRHLFCVSPNLREVQRLLDSYFPAKASGPREAILSRLLTYAVCGDFRAP